MDDQWLTLSTESWDRTIPDLGTLTPTEVATLMNAADATVAQAVAAALPAIGQAIELATRHLAEGGRLFYLGAGTSGRLGVLDAAECPPTFNTDPQLVQALIAGGPPALLTAQEGAEDDARQGGWDLQAAGAAAPDVVVGITASGTTPYVMGGLKWAQEAGLATISLSCNAHPQVATWSDVTIAIETGPEILMGSTRLKAGSAQKMVLNMISTGTMVGLGKTYRNLMVDMRPTNHKLQARAVRIVMWATDRPADQAQTLLTAADGEVKVAIAMDLLDTTAADARARLAAVHGVLGRLTPVSRSSEC